MLPTITLNPTTIAPEATGASESNLKRSQIPNLSNAVSVDADRWWWIGVALTSVGLLGYSCSCAGVFRAELTKINRTVGNEPAGNLASNCRCPPYYHSISCRGVQETKEMDLTSANKPLMRVVRASLEETTAV